MSSGVDQLGLASGLIVSGLASGLIVSGLPSGLASSDDPGDSGSMIGLPLAPDPLHAVMSRLVASKRMVRARFSTVWTSGNE
jgi:hypothetical protein